MINHGQPTPLRHEPDLSGRRRAWWAGFVVGFGPQLLLTAYLLLALITAEPEDRGYAAYLLIPEVLVVLLGGIVACACLISARTRRFGLGALAGMAVGVPLFLVICVIGVNV